MDEYCIACENTGWYKDPNDRELFDKLVDKYDQMGIYTANDCYNKAINEVGYTKIPCPYCERGKALSKGEK